MKAIIAAGNSRYKWAICITELKSIKHVGEMFGNSPTEAYENITKQPNSIVGTYGDALEVAEKTKLPMLEICPASKYWQLFCIRHSVIKFLRYFCF